MRNLKRALSLALASVMLLGMMVVGSGASYADVTSEQNVEAIEVLQAIGVMVGDDNGNFNPDKNVTRNEMAVVMANLMDYRVATYAGTSPFTDVPSWAEPYVAACYTNGITSGTSATTYGGSNTVTAGQAALMLMKALGYFQYASDFGSDWLLATTKIGTQIGLFKGVDAGVREPMTRNDVARLVLNTLKSSMVEPDDDVINVSTGDVAVTVGSITYFYKVDEVGGADSKAIINDKEASGINGTYGQTIELGEELYEGDLKLNDDTRDAFGRPANRWMYGLTEIGFYPAEALAVYTAKVTKGDLYSLVGKSVLDDIARNNASSTDEYTFSVYADGEPIYDGVHGNSGFTTAIREEYFLNNSSAAAGVGYTNNQAGKGVRTEVYLDGDGNLTIAYINTYLAQATANYNDKNNTLNIDVITAPVDFQAGTETVAVTQLSGDDFDLKNYKEDDYILYTVADGDVATVAPATLVSGKVGSYTVESSVTLDGTKYEYAAKIEGSKQNASDTVDGAKATEYRVGDTATLVLDQYGYVLYVDSSAISLANYVYVDGIVAKSGFGNNYMANVYFTDGTSAEVTLNKICDADGDELSTAGFGSVVNAADGVDEDQYNGWYSFSVNSSDKYTLRAAETYAEKASAGLEGDKVEFANGVYGNDNTVLLVDDGDEITVYTGIKNFPTIDRKTGESANLSVNYFKEKDNASKSYAAVAYVYVDDTKFNFSDGVESLLYVLDLDSTRVDTEDNEKIQTWNVVLDGKVQQIESKEGDLSAYELYTKYAVDADGYYEGKATFAQTDDSATDEYDEITMTGDELTVSGSSLRLGGHTYVVTDDTAIVVVVKAADLMDDEDADYEVKFVNGKRLNSLVKGYALDGTFFVVTEDNDSVVAKSIVIELDSATLIP